MFVPKLTVVLIITKLLEISAEETCVAGCMKGVLAEQINDCRKTWGFMYKLCGEDAERNLLISCKEQCNNGNKLNINNISNKDVKCVGNTLDCDPVTAGNTKIYKRNSNRIYKQHPQRKYSHSYYSNVPKRGPTGKSSLSLSTLAIRPPSLPYVQKIINKRQSTNYSTQNQEPNKKASQELTKYQPIQLVVLHNNTYHPPIPPIFPPNSSNPLVYRLIWVIYPTTPDTTPTPKNTSTTIITPLDTAIPTTTTTTTTTTKTPTTTTTTPTTTTTTTKTTTTPTTTTTTPTTTTTTPTTTTTSPTTTTTKTPTTTTTTPTTTTTTTKTTTTPTTTTTTTKTTTTSPTTTTTTTPTTTTATPPTTITPYVFGNVFGEQLKIDCTDYDFDLFDHCSEYD